MTDSKGSWQYSDSHTGIALPSDFSEGWFTTISCSNSNCIAAGTYLDRQALRHPLIMVSQNDDLTWKPAAYKEGALYSADQPDTYLFASTCDSNHCVSVGEYTDPQASATPLLLQSHNSGTTWTKSPISLPPDLLSGWFNAVDCKAGFCIAVGTYETGEANKPLLFFSADKGAHWQIQEPVPDSELGTHLEYGAFMSASCSDMGCIAGGSFSNYFNTYPLIAVSHDKGLNWHYPPSARTSVPAAELGNGHFAKVHCQQTTCLAAGDYTLNSEYFPLLALSKDGGNTWNFPEAINDPKILPENFINGYF
ncbi:MAG: exo-alpha-sialidase [Tatlockia sp.]|nr:exo-alpha-sialidase [Tatlockia sp.]